MSWSSTTANARLAPEDDPIEYAQKLLAKNRAEEAAKLLEDLLARGRGGLLARVTLTRALIAAGDLEEASHIARETALTNPDAAIGALSLGEALLASGKLATAIGEFQRALRLDPAFTRARFLLGEAWLAAGEAEKALEAFEAIADRDGPPELPSRVAEAREVRARTRSDPRYVRHLFDEFSAKYDSRMLQQLSYGAPGILRQLARMLGVNDNRTYAILDLGCGTGLIGEAFKGIAARLDGIDLSPAMIERARARGIYDSLIVGDIEEWLAAGDSAPTFLPHEVGEVSSIANGVARRRGQEPKARRAAAPSTAARSPSPAKAWEETLYTLILAADTLVYLGDLEKVFAGVARRLAPGGLFLFTVEKSDAADFELGPKRRWRHSENYLRRQAERAGLEVAGLLACHPRTEAGIPVAGMAVALSRGAGPSWPHDDAATSMRARSPRSQGDTRQ